MIVPCKRCHSHPCTCEYMGFTPEELVLLKQGLCSLKSNCDDTKMARDIFDLLDRFIEV